MLWVMLDIRCYEIRLSRNEVYSNPHLRHLSRGSIIQWQGRVGMVPILRLAYMVELRIEND